MSLEDLFQRIGAALAIGLLIGLVRGWGSRDEAEGTRAAGFRTLALSGLLGGVSAGLGTLAGQAVLAAAFVVFGVAMTLFHYLDARSDRDVSATGIVAALVTFALGAYAVLGRMEIAAAGAVAAALLLAMKKPMHAWLQRLTFAEIRAFLILLAMTFLLLPILPREAVDPLGALIPYEIWFMAILIAGISFLGYVAVRILGPQAGLAVAGLAGGLASSTATTLTFARLAREEPAAAGILAGGVLLAGAVMIVRVIVIATAVAPPLAPLLALPLGAALLATALGGALLAARAGGAKAPTVTMTTPFDLAAVLKLAALIAAVMFAVAGIAGRFGPSGVFPLAAVSGLADVDAITLSLARAAEDAILPREAALAILIAVASNTAVKTVMAGLVGTWRLAAIVGTVSLAAAALGAGGIILM